MKFILFILISFISINENRKKESDKTKNVEEAVEKENEKEKDSEELDENSLVDILNDKPQKKQGDEE